MSRRRLLGLTAAAAGTVAAGVVAGALAEKRLLAGRRQVIGDEGFGRLRSTPVSVVADDGVCLHAEVDEPDEPAAGEPTLVFVHGYALNLDCWHFQREHFRGSRRMVFYDQRSHGRSDRSTKEHATIDQLGHDLRAVLDQLAADGPVVLVGHSMGGMTIMALADHHPELFGDKVVATALISTTAGGLKTHAFLGRWLPERVMSQVTPRLVAGLARAPGFVDGARRAGSDIGFLATGKLAFGDEVPASYVEFVDEMLAQTSFDVLAEFFPNFDALDKYAVLHAFEKVPTAIICGDRDRLTSVGLSRKMASLIDGARLVECPGAGHMVILERRGEVDAALERLIEAAVEEERAS
jgi:pimeloyl-ACP methyl ester carboxylesterase